MKSIELTFRIVSNLSDVEVEKIELGNLSNIEHLRLKDAFEKLEKANLHIDDTPGITIDELELKITTAVAIDEIREVYIDYIQLIRFGKNMKGINREEGFSDVSKRLKTLAAELDITIIVFSQVTDEVKGRHLKIPMTDDIKYCKAIANDADIVAFLWRVSYYEDVLKTVTEMGGITCSLFPNVHINDFTNVSFIIIAKHRGGKLGKIPVRFKPEIMKISDHYMVLDSLKAQAHENPNQYDLLTPESREVKF